ncbi:SDR family oxidoreductase [Blastococcus xanthinilyticus]|uniref:Short-subunit dehydrogenase n=1 Tax=Blastococcus xanthinilyticus TaxID=1564164 RepID=A0A5S5D7B6_9ACTN|nr:SDR family oxidoreductase [Blastococcus xanthinilyticus]TYP90519.1 short-subunit dehydrogenase [Blastococcus xanthinilyticus]
MKTWFITGASRGFGRELTEQLLARGDRVAATLRRPDQLADLARTYGERLWVGALDVTDTAQLRTVVDAAFADLGRVDIVVSNAGYGVFGAAEELTDEQIDRQVATNLTASIQLARAALPHLRAQRSGLLMQVSSMGAHIGFPSFSLYHATKWGIEGFYEALAGEVEPFGIRTTLVEPGMIRTSFYDAAERTPVHPAYADHPGMARGTIPVDTMPGDQAKVVAVMIVAADADAPPRRLLLGSDAYRMVSAALSDRLAGYEAQRQTTFSTDVDGAQQDEKAAGVAR